jgi:prolipoprotein diacylglyceryltransferase
VIAFSLASVIPVYAFSMLLALGVLAGMLWVAWRAPARQTVRLVDASLLVLLGALIGARAVHVAFNWPYFQEHVWESLLFFQGGLSWPGALAGGLLTLGIYAVCSHQSLAMLADALLPLLVALSASAWLGCWLDGCAYGPPTSAWWGIPSPDEWGAVLNRWPIQFVWAFLTIASFGLLENLPWPGLRKPGLRASLGLFSLALLLLASALLRADPLPAWRGLPIDAWAALGFMIVTLACLPAIAFQERRADHTHR